MNPLPRSRLGVTHLNAPTCHIANRHGNSGTNGVGQRVYRRVHSPRFPLEFAGSPLEVSRALMRRRIFVSGKEGAVAGTVALMNDKGQTGCADALSPPSTRVHPETKSDRELTDPVAGVVRHLRKGQRARKVIHRGSRKFAPLTCGSTERCGVEIAGQRSLLPFAAKSGEARVPLVWRAIGRVANANSGTEAAATSSSDATDQRTLRLHLWISGGVDVVVEVRGSEVRIRRVAG